MPIAIESSSLGQYLNPMESQLVMLGNVISLLNDGQKLCIIDYVSSCRLYTSPSPRDS